MSLLSRSLSKDDVDGFLARLEDRCINLDLQSEEAKAAVNEVAKQQIIETRKEALVCASSKSLCFGSKLNNLCTVLVLCFSDQPRCWVGFDEVKHPKRPRKVE